MDSESRICAGVFGPGNSLQARDVFNALEKLSKVDAEFFDTDLVDIKTRLDQDHISFNNVDLCKLDVCYVHGFSYMNPVAPGECAQKEWSVWQADHLVCQQKYSYLFSLFTELCRQGVKLVNPPGVFVRTFAKPAFFEGLRNSGFFVPKMLCSNDIKRVKWFCGQHKKVVWRTTTGRAAWQLFGDKQREHLVKPDKPPVWLAELLDGPYIRAYVYEGKPLSFLRYQAPDPTPPERLETVFTLACPEAEDVLARLFQQTSIGFCLISFVLHKNTPYLYDIDPDPLFDWLPETFRQELIAGLARGLCKRAGSGQAYSNPEQRPALFLRRMLQTLFTFEKSKRIHAKPQKRKEQQKT